MTSNDLLNCYGIKLPHELGKPLYIQNVDAMEDFKNSFLMRITIVLFSLFGSGVSILMLYGALTSEGHPKYFLFGLLFALLFWVLYESLRTFFDVEMIVVADKGIVRYIMSPKGHELRHEMLLFSQEQKCVASQGQIDPHSPISKGYKYEAKWMEGDKRVFKIIYTPRDPKNKQAMEAAIKAFETYRITRNQP
ncbi:MAG: hypothetical protein WC691_09425 [Sulfuricurvum sp.]|jgi:hypothetical protein